MKLPGLDSVRSRMEAGAARGLSRFVGRDAEVEQLRKALEQAQAGHGQVVAVVGEPGVGKSRLFYEFTRSHRTEGWLDLGESARSPMEKPPLIFPVIDLLKSLLSHPDARCYSTRVREKVTGKILTLDERLKNPISPILSYCWRFPKTIRISGR